MNQLVTLHANRVFPGKSLSFKVLKRKGLCDRSMERIFGESSFFSAENGVLPAKQVHPFKTNRWTKTLKISLENLNPQKILT